MPGGELISPDALALDAGVVHETNGRAAHKRLDLFVLHNSPAQIERRGRLVISQFERCYLRHKGNGLHEGVTLVRTAA